MRRPAEFADAVRAGTRAGSRAVTVHVAAGSDHSGVRVGFVVARSVGSAVVRNRVRRRLRHQMRARLAGLPDGADVVVRAHASAADLPAAMLGNELDKALSRAVQHTRERRR
jgi:ribonuclease P protein component